MIMATPTSTQEVVLRPDDETMQRIIVGVVDHLRDATATHSLTQDQDRASSSTSGNSANTSNIEGTFSFSQ